MVIGLGAWQANRHFGDISTSQCDAYRVSSATAAKTPEFFKSMVLQLFQSEFVLL
jgi:hypothetical protein